MNVVVADIIMTLPLFGSMGEFDPSSETFTVCERFEPRSHLISR